MSIRTALVIGGGIAGPATALALHKAGIEATVFEKFPSSADGLGGLLMMAPNGLQALSVIGLEDAVGAAGQPIARMIIADGRGRDIMEFGGIPGLPPSRILWRSDVYRVLRDATLARGIRIEHGKDLVAVDETPTAVTATFADGSTASADVLIGADGIHSIVRRLIDPNTPQPQSDGLLGLGGESDLTLPGRTDAIHFVHGTRAFLGYWRQPNGRALWFSNLPHRTFMSTVEARAIPQEQWLARLREAYAGDVPAEALVRQTRPERLFVLGSTDMLPEVPRWHRGRMVLVGDSAHAPNHSSGQGASLAIESALELARCLRDLEDPSAAFATYEQVRRPRVARIAREAAQRNRHKAAGPMVTAIMNLVMRLAVKTIMTPEKMFGWVHGYRVRWDERISVPGGQVEVAGTSASGRPKPTAARAQA
jgi:2-polyprenyl-6-methoxyphenol hydroxylase-like FAD-dependent oxidoreductase